ncbi:MAG: UvrD-helicase domain-containing protein [Thermodesulfobacteriota bacterium]
MDEYQDIDELQYQLIAALAGRTLADPDRRLSILAVGDDDQSIYQFRGTNVGFIKRFQADYRARLHALTENYRSSGHIIAAANQLICHNRDRMKAQTVLTVNRARRDLPAGGDWTRLDPVAHGRVQLLVVTGEGEQAQTVAAEVRRLMALAPGSKPSDFKKGGFQARCRAPAWEVPICEIVWQEGGHPLPAGDGVDDRRLGVDTPGPPQV